MTTNSTVTDHPDVEEYILPAWLVAERKKDAPWLVAAALTLTNGIPHAVEREDISAACEAAKHATRLLYQAAEDLAAEDLGES